MLLSVSGARFRHHMMAVALGASKRATTSHPFSILTLQDRSPNQISRSINDTSLAFKELRSLVERVHSNKARKAKALVGTKTPEEAAIKVAEDVAKMRITDKPLELMDIHEFEELVTIAVNHKRFDAIIHIIDSLPPDMQLGAELSSNILRMVRRNFDIKELRRLRKSLRIDNAVFVPPAVAAPKKKPAVAAGGKGASAPPVAPVAAEDVAGAAGVTDKQALDQEVRQKCQLKLKTWDMNETMSTCILKNHHEEAFKWFLTMQDVVQVEPNEATFFLMIPSAITDKKSWDRLFYLLTESRLLGFPVSKRSYEGIVTSCEDSPTVRWVYARSFLLELARNHTNSSTSSTNDIPDTNNSYNSTSAATSTTAAATATAASTTATAATVSVAAPSWNITKAALGAILSAGRYREVLSTWGELNTLSESAVGKQILIPLGLAAIHLGEKEELADSFNRAVKPVSASLSLSASRLHDAKAVHAAAVDLINALNETPEALSKPSSPAPELLGVLIAWLLKLDRKDLAQDVWVRVCSSGAAQSGMRLEHTLSFTCRAALLPGASESYSILVAAFVSELLVGADTLSPSHRAARLLNKSAATTASTTSNSSTAASASASASATHTKAASSHKLATTTASSSSRDDDNFTAMGGPRSGALPLSGELAEQMIHLLALTQDTSAASAVVLECEQRGLLIGLDAFTKVLHMLLRDKEYRLLLDLFELYLSRFDAQQQQLAALQREQSAEGSPEGSSRSPSSSSSSSTVKYSKYVGAFRGKRDNESGTTTVVVAGDDENREPPVAEKVNTAAAAEAADIKTAADTKALIPSNRASQQQQVDANTSLALALGPKIFSPALEALAQLGEYDLMLTLFRSEMPRRGILPRPSNYVTAITALRHGGRYRDGFLLFKEIISAQQQDLSSYREKDRDSSSSSSRGKRGERGSNSSKNKNGSKGEKEIVKVAPIEDSLITAALSCCAEGRLGSEALQIISLVEKQGRKSVSDPASFLKAQRTSSSPSFSSSSAAKGGEGEGERRRQTDTASKRDISYEVRDLALAIKALAVNETVMLIPKVIEVMANNRQRPLIPTRGLLSHSLGAAAALKHKEAADSIVQLYRRHGYTLDDSAIDAAAQAAKDHFFSERGLASGFIHNLLNGPTSPEK